MGNSFLRYLRQDTYDDSNHQRMVLLQESCAPKVNYAAVRSRAANAFHEKANEMSDTVSVLQRLTKESMRIASLIAAKCGA